MMLRMRQSYGPSQLLQHATQSATLHNSTSTGAIPKSIGWFMKDAPRGDELLAFWKSVVETGRLLLPLLMVVRRYR
jgi:hypothetical protein